MSFISDNLERVRARLFRRSAAYQALFLRPDGEVAPHSETVLRDLARYCYVNKPTLKVSPVSGRADPIAMAFAEGRRDVFNRIAQMVRLTPDQITRIVNAKADDE